MKKLIIRTSVAAFLALPAMAKDFYVYPDVRDGLTGSQQMTNILYKLDGYTVDTIHVMPGTYDFTGVTMGDGTQHLTRSHFPISEFKIVGETTGHWDGTVVFTATDGLKMMNFTHEGDWTGWQGAYPTIANITFQSCSSDTEGGAVRVSLWNKFTKKQKWAIVTNCVFKSCQAVNKSGGAVYGGAKVVDCLFDGNSTTGGGSGGAFCGGAAYGCEFLNNACGNHGAAVSSHFGLNGCLFVGNTSPNNGGAVVHGDCPISNCTFRANACNNLAEPSLAIALPWARSSAAIS